MILSGKLIEEEVMADRIVIRPFDADNINPNSYDFRLGDTIKVYKESILDTKTPNEVETIKIPKEGYLLEPDRVYLGHTVETMGSEHYVPIIRGTSSMGRLGLFVHITADLIDLGSINQYTLMLHSVQGLRVYPGMKVGQITFWEIVGEKTLYDGKYQGSVGPAESQVYKDFSDHL